MKPKTALFPVFFAALAGCAARGGIPSAATPAPAPMLTAGDAELSPELRTYPLRALEGRFTAQVEATGAPRVETKLDDEGALQSIVNVPVGDREPVACFVSSDQRDLGTLVTRSTMSLKEKLGMEAASFPAIDVELAQHAPLVWATTRLASPGGKTVDARFALLAREGGSVFCLHVGSLPEGRFEHVVGGLVASARHEGWKRAKFADAAVLRVGGKIRGVAQRRIHDDGRETTATSFFVERDRTWSGLDVATSAKIGKGGEIAVSSLVAAANGQEVYRATVTRTKGNEYAYEKRAGRETTKGTFRAPRPLTTELSRAADVRAFAGGKQRERTVYDLENGPDTIGARTVVMRRVDARSLVLTSKTSTNRCTLANDGLCVKEDVTDEDGEKRSWERLYAEGQP